MPKNSTAEPYHLNAKVYFVYAIIGGLLFGAALVALVALVKSPAYFDIFDLSKTTSIGPTIGGITAPFIGVVAAILTFLAFFMQFKANQMHNLQFNEQSKQKERDKHEEKILYLIKQNRSIVDAMSIDNGPKGIKCFFKMFIEFQTAYKIVESFYGNKIDKSKFTNIAFMIFYNGVGPLSNPVNKAILKDIPDLDKLFEIFEAIANSIYELPTENIPSIIPPTYADTKRHYQIDFDEYAILRLEYFPFDGHATRLGQYFRNLFHILSYTDDVLETIISK